MGKTKAMFGNGLMAGGLVTFILSIISAVIIFDQPAEDSTAYAPEIELAMQVLPTEQECLVWMDAIIPLHIHVFIKNISKVDDEDGSLSPGGLADLFPVAGPSTGVGSVTFKIQNIEREKLPVFGPESQETVPFAFIKKTTYTPFVRSIMKLNAFSLKFWKLMLLGAVLGALGMVGLGGLLLFLRSKK